MSVWITDRSQGDIDHLKLIYSKATNGTWTDKEKAEWVSGMKGAIDYRDFSRIEAGISELASLLGTNVDVKTDWGVNGYLTTSDASRWLSNIESIRMKNSGSTQIATTPTSMNRLSFETMNQIESILANIESVAKTYVTFSGEYMTGEGQYGF
nr:MAG TPA: hypothetical protein [Caudoviricetes sp.]